MVVAIDPLLEGPLLWTPLLIVIAKVLVIFVVGLVATMFMVWYERKVVSGMQNRIGPNKAGPFGMLQTLADGIKAFFKEDLLARRPGRGHIRPEFQNRTDVQRINNSIPIGIGIGRHRV